MDPVSDIEALAAAFAIMRDRPFPRDCCGIEIERPGHPNESADLVLLDADVAGCVTSFLKKPSCPAIESQYERWPLRPEFPGSTPAQALIQSLASTLRWVLPQLKDPAVTYFFGVARALHHLQVCLNNRTTDDLYGHPILEKGSLVTPPRITPPTPANRPE